jgi:uncharacterized protein
MASDFTPDDKWLAELANDCEGELPAEAQAAIATFNAGSYYEQHDQLEALWMALETPSRELYRAILQVGIGYYHVKQGNRRGAIKMLSRALRWIEYLPDACRGVDVAQLRTDAMAMRDMVVQTAEDALHEIDRSMFRPVVMTGSAPEADA